MTTGAALVAIWLAAGVASGARQIAVAGVADDERGVGGDLTGHGGGGCRVGGERTERADGDECTDRDERSDGDRATRDDRAARGDRAAQYTPVIVSRTLLYEVTSGWRSSAVDRSYDANSRSRLPIHASTLTRPPPRTSLVGIGVIGSR